MSTNISENSLNSNPKSKNNLNSDNLKKTDRRVKRTKKLIRDALSDLMMEKDYKEISVKDITDRADLNRGTFYLHYSDTYDLLEKVENELIDNLEDIIDNYDIKSKIKSSFSIVDYVFEHFKENEKICRAFFIKSPNNSYNEKLIEVIVEKGLEIKEALEIKYSDEELSYRFYFVACGLVGLVRKWILDEDKLSKEEFVKTTDKILIDYIKTI